MDADKENNIEVKVQKPQVFFKNIIFNDGTQIDLNHSSVVVFAGANNSGKSQVLKDIENSLNFYNYSQIVVLKNTEYEFFGEIVEPTFFQEHFYLKSDGNYQQYNSFFSFTKEQLKSSWNNHKLLRDTHELFVKRLCTELRLTASNALQRNNDPEKHAIYKLNKSQELSKKISEYFHQAFGVDLVLNRNEMSTIPLHVGQAPDTDLFSISMQDEYYSQVNKLPKLQAQGDGMRSFASILLDTFTTEHTITLIDEPEAFLHPPQARLLGKMLAQNNPENRQLFISTHSEDFLQGLLDADNENVTVIRINRMNNINKMSTLNSDEIKKLWSNPILRYSNILSGLFHEKVVVCESDYDCLFYQAIINAIYEQKNEIAPDLLFTHCGGKSRVKDVVAALKAVNVPVVAVCDFDLINKKQELKSIVSAFGMDWGSTLSADMKIIYDSMNAKISSGETSWEQIKKTGKQGFSGDEYGAYEEVERTCKNAGLYIVPVGEMECFDKTINKEKKDWVYHVLENYDLATESKLESARNFVQEVIDYKLIEEK